MKARLINILHKTTVTDVDTGTCRRVIISQGFISTILTVPKLITS